MKTLVYTFYLNIYELKINKLAHSSFSYLISFSLIWFNQYYFRSEIAKYIKPDSYGLIFGFNFFMSLFMISIFTLLFIQGLVVVIGTKNQVKLHTNFFSIINKAIFK